MSWLNPKETREEKNDTQLRRMTGDDFQQLPAVDAR